MSKKYSSAFVGMSHLGLNYLAAASEKGMNVLGLDNNKKKISDLNKQNILYSEPNLKTTLKKNINKINFSNDFSLLRKEKLIFISQDVDTNSKGKSNLKNLKKLINQTIKFLNKKSILVVLSQIPPGFMRNINFDHSRLYYQVETLIFGNALKRALHPERVIVGCSNKRNSINKHFLSFLKKFKCPIIKMKYESAELTKISINLMLASSITTTNMLSRVCEKISADWYEIIPALRLDKRIGANAYIKPGLGISGGNIERDIYAVKNILKKESVARLVPKTFSDNSKHMKSWVLRILKKERLLKGNKKVGVLGLSYKENTNSTKNSAAIEILKKINNQVKIYDPKARLTKNTKKCFQVKNIEDAIKDSDILLLMTPWKEFKKVNKILNLIKNKKVVLIDPYRIIDLSRKKKNFKYFTIGK